MARRTPSAPATAERTAEVISFLRAFWTHDPSGEWVLAYTRRYTDGSQMIASAHVKPDAGAWTWWVRVVPEAAKASSNVFADAGVEEDGPATAILAAERTLHRVVMVRKL